jgi:phosphate transport system permease protein
MVFLGLVIGYVVSEGVGLIDWHFLTGNFDAETKYVDVQIGDSGLMIDVDIVNYDTKDYIRIKSIDKDSPLRGAVTNDGELFPLKANDILRKVDGENTVGMAIQQYETIANGLSANSTVRFKITRPGEGILPLAVNTLYMIVLSLLIALPISIFSAIFLAEYAKKGRLLELIRFTTSSLAGIPSIVFGLFGMLAFVKVLNLGYSLLAGALTLSIVLLPTVIGQTEEAIKRVPNSFREGSLALGATKLQTIYKVVIPNSISGILVGVLLGVGRIVAESAALLLTAGTAAAMAESVFKSASTLTVKAYAVAKETGDVKLASAIGLVAIVLIIVVNAGAKIVERFDKMKDVM